VSKPRPSGTPAIDALVKAGVPYTLHEYEHDPGNRSFGDETVAALGVPADRVFKTLLTEVTGAARPELIVAIVPVAGQLDLKALASAVGSKKAVMADPAKAERATGYIVGGISPLGQKTRLRVVLDESATGHETIFVSAGKRGQQVELSPGELARLTDARLAQIGR